MALDHAEQREKTRAYEAARQHYFAQRARKENELRKRQERKQNFARDTQIALWMILFIFGAVAVIQNAEVILSWSETHLHHLYMKFLGQ